MFFGRAGQWFGNNDNDGDKMSVFHDLDGSVTGYSNTFVGRADNYLLRHPGCVTVPRWNGVMCTGKYAQVRGGCMQRRCVCWVGVPKHSVWGGGVKPVEHSKK